VYATDVRESHLPTRFENNHCSSAISTENREVWAEIETDAYDFESSKLGHLRKYLGKNKYL
jgi:hypothetical protein